VVKTTLRSLQRQGEVVEVSTERVPPVRGSRTQLGQVVTNLVMNAIEATRGVKGDAPKVRVRVWHEEDRVYLEVRDRGPGIEPRHLAHLFEPFFTTKTEGGTGLGLAITRRIVEEHGGRIQVESAPREGACFVVELPAVTNH
jgi:signal transduction histidine kinase